MRVSLFNLSCCLFLTLAVSCSRSGNPQDLSIMSSPLSKIQRAATADECPNGGVILDYGIDSNGDGSLQANEVTDTYPVCHGEDGENGTNCTVTRDEVSGATTIVCDDGTSATVYDGEDGEDGATGPAGADGEDGATGPAGEDGQDGIDGENGEDGTSCTVTRNEEMGAAVITCTDGTSAIIYDGEGGSATGSNPTATHDGGTVGLPCSVSRDDTNGITTITCPDGSTAMIYDGQDGDDGEDGQNGNDGEDGNSSDDENLTPEVDAGEDDAIYDTQTLVLAGYARDPDGETLTVQWTQISGPTATLTNADSIELTFEPPSVESVTDIVLQLSVSDADEATVVDYVTVTVSPNRIPYALDELVLYDYVGEYADGSYAYVYDIDAVATATDPDGDDIYIHDVHATSGTVWISDDGIAQWESGSPVVDTEITVTLSDGKGGLYPVTYFYELVFPSQIDGHGWNSENIPGFCGLQRGKMVCWNRVDTANAAYRVRVDDDAATGDDDPVTRGFDIATMTVGFSHRCFITTDQKAYCYGYGENGQLGDGDTGNHLTEPQEVSGGYLWKDIKGGYRLTCGIDAQDDLYCWGNNTDYGMLGIGTNGDKSTPQLVNGGHKWASVAPGYFHVCGITLDGAAFCWGYNGYGELGDSTTVTKREPVQVGNGECGNQCEWSQLTTGTYHTCGISTGDQLYCWGRNNYGQVGIGDLSSSSSSTPKLVTASSNTWANVDAGEHYTCALQSTSAGDASSGYPVFCWGEGANGRLAQGDNYSNLAAPLPIVDTDNYLEIAVGYEAACGRKSDKVYCWGRYVTDNGSEGTPVPLDIVRIVP